MKVWGVGSRLNKKSFELVWSAALSGRNPLRFPATRKWLSSTPRAHAAASGSCISSQQRCIKGAGQSTHGISSLRLFCVCKSPKYRTISSTARAEVKGHQQRQGTKQKDNRGQQRGQQGAGQGSGRGIGGGSGTRPGSQGQRARGGGGARRDGGPGGGRAGGGEGGKRPSLLESLRQGTLGKRDSKAATRGQGLLRAARGQQQQQQQQARGPQQKGGSTSKGGKGGAGGEPAQQSKPSLDVFARMRAAFATMRAKREEADMQRQRQERERRVAAARARRQGGAGGPRGHQRGDRDMRNKERDDRRNQQLRGAGGRLGQATLNDRGKALKRARGALRRQGQAARSQATARASPASSAQSSAGSVKESGDFLELRVYVDQRASDAFNARGKKRKSRATMALIRKRQKRKSRFDYVPKAERPVKKGMVVLRVPKQVEIGGSMTVRELADLLQLQPVMVATRLEALGETVESQKSVVEADVAEFLAQDIGVQVVRTEFRDREPAKQPSPDSEEYQKLPVRPPVVAVMGHVDHGKTTLLDSLRSAHVADGEAGGITQGVSCFSVSMEADLAPRNKAGVKAAGGKAGASSKAKKGKKAAKTGKAKGSGGGANSITFIDTPGHALFGDMRARGARFTDLVVLVVAAEDGVMPQTEESVKLCLDKGVPMVVAVTKIDRMGEDEREAAAESISHSLAGLGVQTDLIGGDTPLVSISSMTGEGLEDLREMIQLQGEILELRASRDGAAGAESKGKGKGKAKAGAADPTQGPPEGQIEGADAVVLESKIEKGTGLISDVIGQWGTLQVGDLFVVGAAKGRVRAMRDPSTNQPIKELLPGQPARLLGLPVPPPPPGTPLQAVGDEARANAVLEHRERRASLEMQAQAAEAVALRSKEDEKIAEQERRRKQSIERMNARAGQRHRMAQEGKTLPPELQEQPWEKRLANELAKEAEELARSGGNKRTAAAAAAPSGPRQVLVMLRADTAGGLEALRTAFSRMDASVDGATIRAVNESVGDLSEQDLELAEETGAAVFGFNLKVTPSLQKVADKLGVRLAADKVIYRLVESAAEHLQAVVPAKRVEVPLGVATVKEVFEINSGREAVAGCRVSQGEVVRGEDTMARVVRKDVGVVFGGDLGVPLASLRVHKDSATRVEEGTECGVQLDGFTRYRPGDRIEVFRVQEEKLKVDLGF